MEETIRACLKLANIMQENNSMQSCMCRIFYLFPSGDMRSVEVCVHVVHGGGSGGAWI